MKTIQLYPFFCLGAILLAQAAGAADYEKDVKPVLRSRCYSCHGASQQKGGLRLDTAASIRAGGEGGPAIVSGAPGKSLLIQSVLGTHDTISRMPYKKAPLSESEIAAFQQWIQSGATAPANEIPESVQHWAFVKPDRPQVPAITDGKQARNDIDRFIVSRLATEGIQPSPEAPKAILIRRVSLDIRGIPPLPAEVAAFEGDKRPDAYEQLIDKYLASQQYGEKWGRHWLDGARYADSNGYSIDAPRSMWVYRDWVIRSLNADMPYDRFVIEQMAGDLLPGATPDQKVATGFHRNTQINQEGGIDKEQFRIESIFDRIHTTSTVFLGLTVACAQCHDHKFDPISQREYYELFAFLNTCDEPNLEVPQPGELEARERHRTKIASAEDGLKKYQASMAGQQSVWETSLSQSALDALKPEVREALAVAEKDRSAAQRKAVTAAFHAQDAKLKDLQAEIARLKKSAPSVTTTMVMAERKEPRTTYLFIKGDFTRKGAEVGPGVLKILNPPAKSEKPTRLDLANWIVDVENPLTARVAVNRLWQQYFGRGIVETDNDFGTQGTPPTHPELLDWLATEFQRQKWSLKAMHRLIVTSATYRQSSNVRKDLMIKDPTNRLLARQSRLRLDSELIRDSLLQASGLLSLKVGGPPVFPPIPEGVMSLGQVKRDWVTSEGEDRYRRGIYTFFFRATPYPSSAVFDGPDSFSTCTRRLRSNTPLQALTMLNDRAYDEISKAMAKQLMKIPAVSDQERIADAFRRCTSRTPSAEESGVLLRLLGDSRSGAVDADRREEMAWESVSRALLNMDETITRE